MRGRAAGSARRAFGAWAFATWSFTIIVAQPVAHAHDSSDADPREATSSAPVVEGTAAQPAQLPAPHPAQIPTSQPVGAATGATGARGFTTWQINWRYRLATAADGRCQLQGVEHDVGTRVDLSADADEALRRHEQGHVAIGLAAARRVAQQLADMTGAADCGALRALVERVTTRVLGEYRERERQHDLPTATRRTVGLSLR